jgi:rhomboid protease GluP
MRRRASDALPPEPAASQPQAAFDFAVTPAPAEDDGPMDVVHAGGIPVLTMALVLLLGLIFAAELRFTTDFIGPTTPSARSLIALGGVDGRLVFQDHQWWRLLTAPLLHSSVSHLVGNCVALVMAGFFLEPLLGGPWFLALFVLAGLGGSAGSLAQNDPNIVSVGASGAIMGVMALAFLTSDRAADAVKARKMRVRSLVIGLPAILPAFLGTAHDHVDYGAHIGGFLAGGIVWLLLGLIWRRGAARPALGGAATLLGAGGSGLALVFLAFAMTGPAPAAVAQNSVLVPSAELPRNEEDAIRRSAELVKRWPQDPRSHYLRALYFLEQNDTSDAAEHLRGGIALMRSHADELKPDMGYRMEMTLAAIVRSQGDLAAARGIAAKACAAPETRDWDMRADLVRRKICR